MVDAPDMDMSCITPKNPGSRGDGPLRSLWVGGKPPCDRDMPGFDMVVLCAREYQPEMTFKGRVIRCPIPDGPLSGLELRYAFASSKVIAKALAARQRILVTCAAGINRSVLVACLALARVTRLGADDLIRIMRVRRHPKALYNTHFQDILRRFVGAGRGAPSTS